MNEQSLFSVNLNLLLATLACFGWGFGYGYWLHRSQKGQIFERQYTWLATALGLGVDLFLLVCLTGQIPWEFVTVLIASAVGIIIMALVYGYPVIDNSSFKPKWQLEDSTALAMKCYEDTIDLLGKYDLPVSAKNDIKNILTSLNTLRETLKEARKSIIKKRVQS